MRWWLWKKSLVLDSTVFTGTNSNTINHCTSTERHCITKQINHIFINSKLIFTYINNYINYLTYIHSNIMIFFSHILLTLLFNISQTTFVPDHKSYACWDKKRNFMDLCIFTSHKLNFLKSYIFHDISSDSSSLAKPFRMMFPIKNLHRRTFKRTLVE